MKYVFFDIECACVYKNTAKICAFGYVLTDENFQVLAQEDILINPKGKAIGKIKYTVILPFTGKIHGIVQRGREEGVCGDSFL